MVNASFTKIIILFALLLIPLKIENKTKNINVEPVYLKEHVIKIDNFLYNKKHEINRASIYHAVPWQTNEDNFTTASGFKLNHEYDHFKYRILAVSRDLLISGISYGDIVLVAGTGKYDGLWRIEDTMNARYSNTIDFLVDPHIQYGLYSNVAIYSIN